MAGIDTTHPDIKSSNHARTVMLAIALVISALSLYANFDYWTVGVTGQSYWVTGIIAGSLEVLIVGFFWLANKIWKLGGKGIAIALVIFTILPWGLSSATNFMWLSQTTDRNVASLEASLSSTIGGSLQRDLERNKESLGAFSDFKREDIASLEALLARCQHVSKDECVTTDVQSRLATNRQINELETAKAKIILDMKAHVSQQKQTLEEAAFSWGALKTTFSENLFSREMLVVVLLDLVKIIFFLLGLWISLRIYKIEAEETEQQTDLVGTLDERIKTLEAMVNRAEEAAHAATEQARDAALFSQRANTASDEIEGKIATLKAKKATAPKPSKPKLKAEAKPATAPKPSSSDAANYEVYKVPGPDGTMIEKRRRVA